MSYVLENAGETQRLEFQARLNNYQLKKELVDLKMRPGQRVLDAGCGSGLVSRYLLDQFPQLQVDACDNSPLRLQQARELAAQGHYPNLQFFASGLERIERPSAHYHWVVCRFVLEHLANPLQACQEFHRVLRPSEGQICIVDLDGIVFNLFTSHKVLNGLLHVLQQKWETDLYIGRKIPCMLKSAGFKHLRWNIQTMEFHGQDLQDEILLTQQRLAFIRPVLDRLFASEKVAENFTQLYLEEMSKEESTLFYNKFIVYAQCP